MRKKSLSVFSLVMINIVAIDSLRNLPINAQYGFGIVFFYVLASVIFLLPCALVSAELATSWPKTGGAYIWVREAFGKRWGFANIWLQWIYNVVWYPTILAFIAASICYLFNPALVNNKLYMVISILLMFGAATLLNCLGITFSSIISEIGAIAGTMLPMVIMIILGVTYFFQHTGQISLNWSNFFPSISHWHNISFLVVILFSLMGIEMSAVHAEDVEKPEKDYPKALMISTLMIFFSLTLASLAIAIIVPKGNLSLVDGINQTFSLFFNAFHLNWMLPVIEILIIIGAFSGMSTWVIGPTRGLQVAAEDQCAPGFFAKVNRAGSPTPILLAQAVIVLVITLSFILLPSVNAGYWLLSDLTAQLALIYYLTVFAAAIKLRYSQPERPTHAYLIPGGKLGIWVVAGIGILTCIAGIIVGLIPPSTVSLGNILRYELLLIGGMIVFSVPPFLIYRRQKANG